MRNLLAYYPMPMGPMGPANMLQLAAAEDDFDPNSLIAQMLRAQRAAAAQAPPPKPQPRPVPQGQETPEDVLRRRMREQGLE